MAHDRSCGLEADITAKLPDWGLLGANADGGKSPPKLEFKLFQRKRQSSSQDVKCSIMLAMPMNGMQLIHI